MKHCGGEANKPLIDAEVATPTAREVDCFPKPRSAGERNADEPVTHLGFKQVELAAVDLRDLHLHVASVDEAYF